VDANGLYGSPMNKRSADRCFKWIDEEEWESIGGYAQTADQDQGHLVHCYLDYPEELHDTHSDCKLAPERMTVYSVSAEQISIGEQHHT
jgi:uncharacterized protein YyaL (SSP411 family)